MNTSTLKEKIIRAFPKEKVVLKCRNYLQTFVNAENPKCKVNKFDNDDYLFINGRISASSNLKNILKVKPNEEKVFLSKGIVVAAKVSAQRIREQSIADSEIIDTKIFSYLPTVEVDIPVANYLWDLIYLNGNEIQNEFKIYTQGKSSAKKKYAGVNFV